MNKNQLTDIGIKSYATYIPSGRMGSAELADLSGIPEPVLRQKFGIHAKAKATEAETPAQMGLTAARECLRKAQIPAEKLDAVIYFGSEYKDHYVWVCSTWLIEALGAKNAIGFDQYAVCTGLIISMKTAVDMMRGNPELKNILLVGAAKESDLLDYQNQLSRFIFNFGDGAGAILLQRDLKHNRFLSAKILVDGRFSQCLFAANVGAGSGLHAEKRQPVFVVNDPQKMKADLDPVSIPNFVKVIGSALAKIDKKPEDVAFLGLLHAKRSFILSILEALNIAEEKTYYAWEYGHIQSLDPLIALENAEQQKRLQNGDLIVLASAGAGYTWGALTLQWGHG